MDDSTPTVITTGAAGSGAVAPRLDIFDFAKDTRYFSLYIQALGG